MSGDVGPIEEGLPRREMNRMKACVRDSRCGLRASANRRPLYECRSSQSVVREEQVIFMR